MVASVLIIGFSFVLLVYWFRYSCLLLLRSSVPAESAILDQRFGFARVKEQLQPGANLDALHQMLAHDYRLLTYLLEHAAGLNLDSLEDRLLVVDYRVMQWYYRLTKTAAPEQARHALSEMAAVVGVLVQHMSEQAGVQAQA
ncbi:MAG: hypothetical protein P4L56_31755 [Candidatus Sulfopaludibacter sp.]|nr:hypothetical protein [Candidatus Sulfopaludibacter sp.]